MNRLLFNAKSKTSNAMPLTSDNLLWVKNIKYNDGNAWAYMDQGDDEEFVLHFSNQHAGGAGNAQIGEVILLFQKVSLPNYHGLYLTHLVTPSTNQIVNELDEQYPFGRLVKIVARPPLHQLILKPANLNFLRPNRGGCCSLGLIKQAGEAQVELEQLQNLIWNLFEDHLRPAIIEGA